jgi:hypothetical protein
MKNLSRREAFGAIMGAAVAGGALLSITPSFDAHAEKSKFPWIYQKLDKNAVAEKAYWGFYEEGRGCCYGVFASIVEALADKHGAPYNSFPCEMMTIGKSGIAGWGSVCGALLGGAMAVSLFYGLKEHTPLINELFRWYESAAMPTYVPSKPKVQGPCQETVSGSILCHVSASKWCFETKFDTHSAERSERCARVTGEVARKNVEILNASHDRVFAFSGFSDEVKQCKSCHDKDNGADYAKGNMNCRPCHSQLSENHPK